MCYSELDQKRRDTNEHLVPWPGWLFPGNFTGSDGKLQKTDTSNLKLCLGGPCPWMEMYGLLGLLPCRFIIYSMMEKASW